MMNTVHLYGFVRPESRLPPERDLVRISSTGVDAIVGKPSGTSPEDLVEHAAIVQELLDLSSAVVPARFSGELDPAVVVDFLAERADDLRRDLDQVEGRVEFAIRIRSSESVPQKVSSEENTGPGTTWLNSRVQHFQQHAQLRNLVTERVASKSDSMVELPQRREWLIFACLVSEGETEDFLSAVNEVRNLEEVEVSVSGPWAPYSFVTGSSWDTNP
jgi:hypothetical protein